MQSQIGSGSDAGLGASHATYGNGSTDAGCITTNFKWKPPTTCSKWGCHCTTCTCCTSTCTCTWCSSSSSSSFHQGAASPVTWRQWQDVLWYLMLESRLHAAGRSWILFDVMRLIYVSSGRLWMTKDGQVPACINQTTVGIMISGPRSFFHTHTHWWNPIAYNCGYIITHNNQKSSKRISTITCFQFVNLVIFGTFFGDNFVQFPSFRSQEQKDLKDGNSKSQTVGSLLSAYDDDSHDETEDTGKNTVAKVETGPEMKTVPTVESRSWSNWEDMWLSFSLTNFWGGASQCFWWFCLEVFGVCFSCKMTDLMYLIVFRFFNCCMLLCDGKVPKLLRCTSRI